MHLQALPKHFDDRNAMILHIKTLSLRDDITAGSIIGGLKEANERLSAIDPLHYGKTRNFLDGSVSRLSPYIRHGVLSLSDVRDEALTRCSDVGQAYKFVQELAWRDFWQRLYNDDPMMIYHDIEPYKTGFTADDYATELPDDIRSATTGVACIDGFIRTLLDTGYMHNHTRMYVAAYVVHWRRIRWQAGAEWFLHHLLDGDPASNNLSWQWIASTFSRKPYIFNLDNVRKYADHSVNTSSADNAVLDKTYEVLSASLFPNLQQGSYS